MLLNIAMYKVKYVGNFPPYLVGQLCLHLTILGGRITHIFKCECYKMGKSYHNQCNYLITISVISHYNEFDFFHLIWCQYQ